MKSIAYFAGVILFASLQPLNASSMAAGLQVQITSTSKTSLSVLADTSINGKWFLQPVLPSDTAAGKIPELKFDLSKKTFSGNTGCNSMNGSFEKKGATLVFNENIITTKMACTGYNEDAFFKNLLRVNHYKINNGVLILMMDATALSRWTRKADRKPKMNKT